MRTTRSKRFKPNCDLVWSKDRKFKNVTTNHVINESFINNRDYDKGDEIVAVIADSYIKVFMVAHEESLQRRLARELSQKDILVYNFGVSGAPLSQYLAYAERVSDEYRPLFFVCTIVGIDFDESLLPARNTGFHYLAKDDEGLTVIRTDYQPSLSKRVLRNSALARHLVSNLKVHRLWNRLVSTTKKEQILGNFSAFVFEDLIKDSKEAVDTFLLMLGVLERRSLRAASLSTRSESVPASDPGQRGPLTPRENSRHAGNFPELGRG